MNEHLDAQDKIHLYNRIEAFSHYPGPRVGDFVRMLDGSIQRFSYDWGDTIQTTDGRFGQSFHMFKTGGVSFSGGLNKAIPKASLVQTDETKVGKFWFFSHEEIRAHNGVDVLVKCRVFQQIEG